MSVGGAASVFRLERRIVSVTGSDAGTWLNDLLTARIEDLPSGRARTALLLTPTGRVRAVVGVAIVEREILLVQDPTQPEPIEVLLGSYVLSSDVHMAPRDEPATYLAAPRGLAGAASTGGTVLTPSFLGQGVDVIEPAALPPEGDLGTADDLDSFRVRGGLARFPADLAPDSLPHEARFADAIDESKGCFLGQEAVAKVRNLGHPPRLLLHVRADGSPSPGDIVLDEDGTEVGQVTSAPRGAGGHAIARIRWDARDAELGTAGGLSLTRLDVAVGAA